MGLLGGNLLFDVAESLRLGVASYGAVRGERGGFITLGITGEVTQRVAPSLLGHAGLFVGGGGGRSNATLVGGGLMLRADLGLSYESPSMGSVGMGISHVRFPSGSIRSTQPYLQYDYPFYSLLATGWSSTASQPASGEQGRQSAQPQEFSLVARSYRIAPSVLRVDGQPQHARLQLMGVQWTSYGNDGWFAQLEAEGAEGGQSSGYMQILAGGGYRVALGRSTALKFQAAAGPAGGGSVDTGGGLLLDAGVALQQQLAPGSSLGLSLAQVRAPSRSFSALSLGLELTHRFGLASATNSGSVSKLALEGFDAEHMRVRAVSQSYFKASPQWRNSDVNLSVSNLGVQVDDFVAPQWYLTGQALTAYAGQAGAYTTGLLGAGTHRTLSPRCYFEAEALVGAAGGGGLAINGGLVTQFNAGLGVQLSKALSVQTTAGRIAAVRGPFKANVAGISLAYQFSAFAQN